mgnify:CR=1 FL=1
MGSGFHVLLDIARLVVRGQYPVLRYTERLADIAAAPSIGTVADSYDNAMAESLNGIFKTEMYKPMGP